MTSNGSQNSIVVTERPEFPWLPHEKLYAVPLNNKFIADDQLMANLAHQIVLLQQGLNLSLGVSITANWGGNSAVSAGPYMLIGTSAYKFTIESMDMSVGTSDGSFHVTFFTNGVPIPGLEDVLVDAELRSNLDVPSRPVIEKGAELSMLIFDITDIPTNGWLNLNGTTVAIPEQVAVSADGTVVTGSTVFAVGMGPRDGEATGAVFTFTIVDGRSEGSTHFFVMDDPIYGALDINPIG